MTVSGSPRTLPHKSPRATGGVPLEERWANLLGSEVYYDEFSDGKIDAGWTKVDNSGHTAPTWTETNGSMSVSHTTGTDSGPGGHYLVRDISSLGGPPLYIETCTRGMIQYNTSYIMNGLSFRSGTTWGAGTQVVNMPYAHGTSNGGYSQSIRGFTSDTTPGLNINPGIWLTPWERMYIRLVWVSANTWNGYWSQDGINWFSHGNQSFTSTPAYAGFYVSNWATSTIFTASFDYFRVYSSNPDLGGDTL
jgi:hypothetical protein